MFSFFLTKHELIDQMLASPGIVPVFKASFPSFRTLKRKLPNTRGNRVLRKHRRCTAETERVA